MHAELILRGPLAAPEATRLPALELLLARGRTLAADTQSYAEWLAQNFGVEPLPAGALTAGAEGFWLRADPVHLRLMRDPGLHGIETVCTHDRGFRKFGLRVTGSLLS